MKERNLDGKLAVVTGASRGIGRHIARALHAAGATVAITGRNAETLADAARRIGAHCHPYVCDQRSETAVQTMAQQVLAERGTPDILVNNAGVGGGGPVESLSLAEWDRVIGTNLTGVFLTTRAFVPAMKARNRGDIFMISSMSGKKGDPGATAYAASKFGLQGFSQALTYEVRGHNIRVMVLNPSSVDTRENEGPEYGTGLHLHAADLAEMIVHLACLPGRTLFRDMDIWGTNP
ncbi:MAG TPA: SDR family oxidoreductase [Candidatus Sumerlaeota bacterium]|nr:SDR family oxidoreductase [Candidatus Sumerlaeota bacterium]HPK03975.1 SDR family oxidoreductase [Candidatus Sumerlaeota bacterium]